jgi:hypothetical protein
MKHDINTFEGRRATVAEAKHCINVTTTKELPRLKSLTDIEERLNCVRQNLKWIRLMNHVDRI